MGEALGEIGTLTLTFVPIYTLIENKAGRTDWTVFGIALLVGIALLLGGSQVERKR